MNLAPCLLAAVLASAPVPDPLVERYHATLAARLPVLLSEVLRFPTVAGNEQAQADQKAWLTRVARSLGLAVRDAGRVTEVELTAPRGAPVLGLVVHGDVQPVDDHWGFPPFGGVVQRDKVFGRGAADDKGPLVQALLALATLKGSGLPLTHTVRLLVGSDEESANRDMAEYLKGHAAPDYSLVLDSAFPVVVGEKAWNALSVACALSERGRGHQPWTVTGLEAGLAPSIVPDVARVRLKWNGGPADWHPLRERLHQKKWPPGLKWDSTWGSDDAELVVYGRAAHAGVNLEGGRNALVGLARALEGELNPGCADDLLAFARMAGEDLYGKGFGLTGRDPLWGRWAVNVATVKPSAGGLTELTVNLRSPPPMQGPAREAYLRQQVAAFEGRTGARFAKVGGYFKDEPLAFDPEAKLVKRLLGAYARATGAPARPAISGGGTYAKRLPNAIAFGMWLPGKPYPGHDVDEAVDLADLQRGVDVLLTALGDLALGPKIISPFAP